MLDTSTSSQVDWDEIIDSGESGHSIVLKESIARIFDTIRACKPEHRARLFESLCVYLDENKQKADLLGQAVYKIVADSDVSSLLTESGVPGNKGFLKELLRRLERKVLPEMEVSNDLRTSIRCFFSADDDYKWVHAIPNGLWIRLFATLDIGEGTRPFITVEWATSMRILSHHIASLGLQSEITQRLQHLDDANSPFLKLSTDVIGYIERIQHSQPEEMLTAAAEKVLETISTCYAEVERLRAEKRLYGTSLRLTSLSYRLLRLLNRLENLLMLTFTRHDTYRMHLLRLLREVVAAETKRDHLLLHIRESGDLLAVEVVGHAAKKGSKYITSGQKEFWMFFVASLGGGLIVAIFALIKLFLKVPGIPLGIEGLMYGINYSICFVIIYLTGSALATKQPAMTANTLAHSFEENAGGQDLERLEDLIVRVWRSQFISFAGNLLMALPVAFGLSVIYHQMTGSTIMDAVAATAVLDGINPLSSGALIYAAVAGVFLFLAGLVAGWVDNRNLYRQYPQRIASHPFIVRIWGSDRAKRMGAFWDRNLGILAGNIVLGFCLGSTATVGKILGLPLDIRHIAFSSAEFGVSLEVLGAATPQQLVLPAAIGVLLIGLVNFLVSFGLSLSLALESRRVKFKDTRRLLVRLMRRMVTSPLDWFFPPRRTSYKEQ